MSREERHKDFECVGDTAMVMEHIQTLTILKENIKSIASKQDTALENQREIFKRMNSLEKAVLKIEVEKKTALGVVGAIGGIIGTIITWMVNHLF